MEVWLASQRWLCILMQINIKPSEVTVMVNKAFTKQILRELVFSASRMLGSLYRVNVTSNNFIIKGRNVMEQD